MDLDPSSERNHAYRTVVRETVADLGLSKFLHLDGRGLLRGVTDLSADALRPPPVGMEEIAVYLAMRIQRTMAT